MSPRPQPPVSVSSAQIIQNNLTTSQHQLQSLPQTSRKSEKESHTNFWDTYEHLCALQNLMPLQSLKSCLSSENGANLSLNADKLKSSDWEPIFSALKSNKSLRQISIISNFSIDNDSETNRLIKGFAKLKKIPSIRSKERINKLCRCLKESLQISVQLNTLELYNLPLTCKDLSHISKGLRANKSLKILSMDRCQIGDEGLAIICKDIQSSNNLNRINFSSCNLTHDGAEILANLIKVQALKRHNEAWKDSLRYGRPDLDSMFGIRRITINSNPLIGDRGVYLLSEAFKSDLWLKALDLQDCGITTTGANHLLDGLKFNAMMHVLDVRLNVEIDRDTLQKIMEQVMINSSGHSTYEWMDLTQAAAVVSMNSQKSSKDTQQQQQQQNALSSNMQQQQQQQQTKMRIKKRRNTNASFSKKNQFISSMNSHRMKRCKSTGSVAIQKSPQANQQLANQRQSLHLGNTPTASGIPWRTAARADRYRVSSSCAYRRVMPSSSSSSLFRFNEIDNDNEDEDENYENLIRELNSQRAYKKNTNDEDDEKPREADEEDEEDDGGTEVAHLIEPISQQTDNIKHIRHRMRNINLNKNENSRINPDELLLANSHKHQSIKITANSTFNDYEKLSSSSLAATKSHKLIKNEFASNLDRIKNVSVKDLLNILQREQQSKTQLEDMLIELQEENTKLKSQVSVLKHKLDSNERRGAGASGHNITVNNQMNRTLLDDDKALEIIELTLYKYQNFLDFLRNAGFGKLIEIGEMDQKQEQNKKPSKTSGSRNQQSRDQLDSSTKLTDQQKYYLDKINKAKSKMNKNIMESTQVSTTSNTKSIKLSKHSSHIDMFEEAGLSIVGDLENHHIDTLLPNALEISRSYRDRLNSSSVNSSMINNTHYTNTNAKRKGNEMILGGIKEISVTHTDIFEDDSILPEVTMPKSSKPMSRTKYRENKSVISSIEEVPNDSNEFKMNAQINQSSESNSNRQAESKKVSNNSNTSTVSPATTIIANNAPAVSVRKTIQASKSSYSDELDEKKDKKEETIEDDFEEDEQDDEDSDDQEEDEEEMAPVIKIGFNSIEKKPGLNELDQEKDEENDSDDNGDDDDDGEDDEEEDEEEI